MKKPVVVIGTLALLGGMLLLALNHKSAVDPAIMAEIRNYAPSVDYDRFSNNTRFSLTMRPVDRSGEVVTLYFSAFAPGEAVAIARSETISLSVNDYSDSILPVVFLLDGTSRIRPTKDEWTPEGSNLTMVSWGISQSDMRKIAAARSVEVRAADTDIVLSDLQLSRLRDFAEYLPN